MACRLGAMLCILVVLAASVEEEDSVSLTDGVLGDDVAGARVHRELGEGTIRNEL